MYRTTMWSLAPAVIILVMSLLSAAEGPNAPMSDCNTIAPGFLSYIPKLQVCALNRAQVLNIKQYYMRHGVYSRSTPKGNARYMFLLLCISNDIHPHPGPPRRGPKYPCGVCHKAVRWSRTRKAVACDTCDVWYHTDCMGMGSATYEALYRSEVTWICANCNTPNYSVNLLDSYIEASVNRFSPLNSLNSDNSPTDSSTSIGTHTRSPGSPILRSSPIRPNIRNPCSCPIKVLTANVQCLTAKKEVFWQAVEMCGPDIIIANETWLKLTVFNSEVMPPGFHTLRRDRADGWGGILLAVSHDLTDTEININTNAEILAMKMETADKTSLVIISVDRPPNADLDYALELQ